MIRGLAAGVVLGLGIYAAWTFWLMWREYEERSG